MLSFLFSWGDGFLELEANQVRHVVYTLRPLDPWIKPLNASASGSSWKSYLRLNPATCIAATVAGVCTATTWQWK